MFSSSGMSEKPDFENSEYNDRDHHNHNKNVELTDLVMDTEHLEDDLNWYTKEEFDGMGVNEKVFSWFTAHDGDEDKNLDGLELIKSLNHEHNYHHPEEPEADGDRADDSDHDPHQHTPAAERKRFRRIEKIVDKILDEDDSNKDGFLSFPEFITAFQSGKLEGIKLRKYVPQ